MEKKLFDAFESEDEDLLQEEVTKPQNKNGNKFINKKHPRRDDIDEETGNIKKQKLK